LFHSGTILCRVDNPPHYAGTYKTKMQPQPLWLQLQINCRGVMGKNPNQKYLYFYFMCFIISCL